MAADPIGALAHLQLGRVFVFVGEWGQGQSCLRGFLGTLERRRSRRPNSEESQSRVRQTL